MFKPYLRSIVRNGGKGRMGLGIELFRLDAIAEEDLTIEETEAASEGDANVSTAIMRIYEDIGEDFWSGTGVSAKRFADELNNFGEIKRLNVHINCLGGDVFTAQAIHSIISDHESKKTAYIDGVAASAATVIACAADEVVARLNTNYMIHYPWAMSCGNADTMRKAADDLDKITIPIISVYKEKVNGKIHEEKIRSLMEDETWMTAEEALEYGFVDKVRGKIKAIAKVNKTQIMCSGKLMDIARYHYSNVPKYPNLNVEFKAKAEAKPIPEEPEQKATNKMTREEIDPHLLSEIQSEARVAERTRLAALDAMSGPGLSEIIAKAKNDGKEPKDIAMECFNVTKEELAVAKATSALARDAKPANAVVAGEAPVIRPKNDKDRVSELIVGAFRNQNGNVSRKVSAS